MRECIIILQEIAFLQKYHQRINFFVSFFVRVFRKIDILFSKIKLETALRLFHVPKIETLDEGEVQKRCGMYRRALDLFNLGLYHEVDDHIRSQFCVFLCCSFRDISSFCHLVVLLFFFALKFDSLL